MQPLTPEALAARETLKRIRHESRLARSKTAVHQSKFRHVNWNANARRWQVHIACQGVQTTLGVFQFHDQELAARVADQARWFLQDFLPRAPKYNFPDELPPIDEPSKKVLELRKQFLQAGCPKNAPHHPDFVAPETVSASVASCEVCCKPSIFLDAEGLCLECAAKENAASSLINQPRTVTGDEATLSTNPDTTNP